MRSNLSRMYLRSMSAAPLVAALALFLNSAACAGSSKTCSKEISGMRCIPAGTFVRGSDSHLEDEKPAQKIHISTFYMDTYEVTNAEFNECLDAGKCRDCLKDKTCDYVGARYGFRYKKPKQPVSGVSWFSAREYCRFRGKRLPTEAEWEKAARGPDGNLYSWGNEPADCSRAIIQIGENDKTAIKGCFPKRVDPKWHMHTAEVGSRAPGVYGLYDMAGNVHEWVNDWYEKSYTKCGEACSGNDPKGPCAGADKCPGYTMRSVRGGSWWWTADYARGSKRRANVPGNMPMADYHHFGFRCAQDATP